MRKQLLTGVAIFTLLWPSPYSFANETEISFIDLPSTHWAYTQINEMVQKGIFSGYEDSSFHPQQTITRAELAAVLAKVIGVHLDEDGQVSYDDVSTDAWYAPYAEAVKSYLPIIQNDTGLSFHPEEPATREDLTVAIAKWKGWKAEGSESTNQLNAMFTDGPTIAADASPYIAAALAHNVISGYDDGTFQPKGAVTRAEAAAILARVIAETDVSISPQAASQSGIPNPNTNSSAGNMSATEGIPQLTRKDKPSVDTLKSGVRETTTRETTEAGFIGPWGPWFTTHGTKSEKDPVHDLLVDSEDRIYILRDNEIEKVWPKEYKIGDEIRINSKFNFQYVDDSDQVVEKDYAGFSPVKFAYDPGQGTLAVLGERKDTIISAHRIRPDAQFLTYYKDKDMQISSDDMFLVLKDGRALFSSVQSRSIYLGGTGKEALKSSLPYTDASDRKLTALESNGAAFLYDTGNQAIYRVDLNNASLEKVASIELKDVESVTAHEGKFYAVSGSILYEISLDGGITTAADFTSALYKPVPDDINLTAPTTEHVKLMSFDRNNNVVYYDPDHGMIRRLHIFEDVSNADSWAAENPQNTALSPLSEQSADRLSVNIWGTAFKDEDLYDITEDPQGNLYTIEPYYDEHQHKYLSAVRKYDYSTGRIGSYQLLDQLSFIDKQGTSEVMYSGLNFAAKRILYNAAENQLLIAGTYGSEALGVFAYENVKGTVAASNTKKSDFTKKDFIFTAPDHRLVYSDVAQNKIFIQHTMSATNSRQNEYEVYDFDFSGEAAAGLVYGDKLYLLDSGNRKLTRMNAYDGSVEDTITIDTDIQQITSSNGKFYYVDGQTINEISLDGTIRNYVDLDRLKLNDGILNPSSQEYASVSSVTQPIDGVSQYVINDHGNVILIDNKRVLWKLNLYSN